MKMIKMKDNGNDCSVSFTLQQAVRLNYLYAIRSVIEVLRQNPGEAAPDTVQSSQQSLLALVDRYVPCAPPARQGEIPQLRRIIQNSPDASAKWRAYQALAEMFAQAALSMTASKWIPIGINEALQKTLEMLADVPLRAEGKDVCDLREVIQTAFEKQKNINQRVTERTTLVVRSASIEAHLGRFPMKGRPEEAESRRILGDVADGLVETLIDHLILAPALDR